MKALLAAVPAITVMLTAAAGAAEMPRYDAEAYCQEVSDISGGSAMIFNGCMDMEQTAYNKRKGEWASIPSRAAEYCDEVARVSGGSYMILDGCLDMEADAGANTPAFQY